MIVKLTSEVAYSRLVAVVNRSARRMSPAAMSLHASIMIVWAAATSESSSPYLYSIATGQTECATSWLRYLSSGRRYVAMIICCLKVLFVEKSRRPMSTGTCMYTTRLASCMWLGLMPPKFVLYSLSSSPRGEDVSDFWLGISAVVWLRDMCFPCTILV